MAYCTPQDVRAVLARDVAVATGTAAELSDTAILAQIDAAQAEVDTRIANRYTVPFPAPVPALLKSMTIDVAAYLATLLYRQSKDIAQFDPIVLRYQRAKELLAQLADGTIDLPVTATPGDGGAQPSGAARTRNPYTGNLFGPDDWGLGYSQGRRRSYPRGW